MPARKHPVQMITDNHDILHNEHVHKKYPALYQEVKAHDLDSRSSWYRLSDDAYQEWLAYKEDKDIGYIN